MTTQEISENEKYPQVQIETNEAVLDLASTLKQIAEAGLGDRTIRVTMTTSIDILPRK